VDGGPENLAPPPGRRVSARCARAGAVLSELLIFAICTRPATSIVEFRKKGFAMATGNDFAFAYYS